MIAAAKESMPATDSDHHRVIIAYGPDIQLSIYAGPKAHSNPKLSMPGMSDYRSVELAFAFKMSFEKPSAAGVEGFDDIFETNNDQPVAGFVAQETVEDLKERLAEKFGEGKVHVVEGGDGYEANG